MAATAAQTQCRHCKGFSFASPSYASVLTFDGQSPSTILPSLESRCIPCVSAICPVCDRISIITDGSMESFVRTVHLWKHFGEWIDLDWNKQTLFQKEEIATAAVVMKTEESDSSSLPEASAIHTNPLKVIERPSGCDGGFEPGVLGLKRAVSCTESL